MNSVSCFLFKINQVLFEQFCQVCSAYIFQVPSIIENFKSIVHSTFRISSLHTYDLKRLHQKYQFTCQHFPNIINGLSHRNIILFFNRQTSYTTTQVPTPLPKKPVSVVRYMLHYKCIICIRRIQKYRKWPIRQQLFHKDTHSSVSDTRSSEHGQNHLLQFWLSLFFCGKIL